VDADDDVGADHEVDLVAFEPTAIAGFERFQREMQAILRRVQASAPGVLLDPGPRSGVEVDQATQVVERIERARLLPVDVDPQQLPLLERSRQLGGGQVDGVVVAVRVEQPGDDAGAQRRSARMPAAAAARRAIPYCRMSMDRSAGVPA
jgi:hypothetical protein